MTMNGLASRFPAMGSFLGSIFLLASGLRGGNSTAVLASGFLGTFAMRAAQLVLQPEAEGLLKWFRSSAFDACIARMLAGGVAASAGLVLVKTELGYPAYLLVALGLASAVVNCWASVRATE